MTIPITCACGKKLSVKDDFAGRKVKCPACQKLMMVPALEEFAEVEFADEPDELPQKSRGRERPTARGKGSQKGKKSSGSNRGLLIWLVTGGGVLVVGLLAWLLWPAGPDVVANAPAENTAETTAIAEAGGTASSVTPPAAVPDVPTGGTASNPGLPSTQVATMPNLTTPVPVASSLPATPQPSTNSPAEKAVEVTGDLKTLQGDWHVVELQSDPPAQPGAIDEARKITYTYSGDCVNTTLGSRHINANTVKLDPTQNPKTIDIITNDGPQAGRKVLGIYSLQDEILTLVLRSRVRPTSFKLEPGSMQTILVFNRGRPVGLENAQDGKFDYKAWQAAESQLKAMKVFAIMDSVAGQPGVDEGITHVVIISPPQTPDGTLSPKLWAIVSSISHVIIRPTFTTDATLQQVSQHPGLVGLNLSGRFSVTPAGIAQLKSCSHLRSLYFSEVPVTTELLTAVSQLDQLRNFGIYKSPMTSEMLGSVVQLNQLESLSLQETGLTDADAAQIAKLTKLKSLLLNGSKLTDSGLKTLQSLKELTYLDVRGIAVTPQSVAELEAALPKCKVQK